MAKLLFILFLMLGAHNSYAQAMPTLSKDAIVKCADAGVAECQYKLAEMVEGGKLFQSDLNAAKALYEMAYRNGHEKAGADILRLAKASGLQVGAEAAPQSEQAGPDPGGAADSVRGAKAAGVQTPQNVPVKVGRGNSELRFGGAYIGQAEIGFTESALEATCETDELQGVSVRSCHGVIRRGGWAAPVMATFYEDRMFSLWVALESPEQCNELVEDFTRAYGKTVARWRSAFLSAATGALAKFWGQKGVWFVAVTCEPPNEGGTAVFFGGDIEKLNRQIERNR